jgi:hypothetical protein
MQDTPREDNHKCHFFDIGEFMAQSIINEERNKGKTIIGTGRKSEP